MLASLLMIGSDLHLQVSPKPSWLRSSTAYPGVMKRDTQQQSLPSGLQDMHILRLH